MFPQFHVGFRAGVSHAGSTMRVNFSPHEVGPDAGIVATDPTAQSLAYSVYFPGHAVQDLKLPGSGKALGPDAPVRAPGWNTVRVADRFAINGVDLGHGEPGNLGCFPVGPRAPAHVCVTSWAMAAQTPAPSTQTPGGEVPPVYRFAD